MRGSARVYARISYMGICFTCSHRGDMQFSASAEVPSNVALARMRFRQLGQALGEASGSFDHGGLRAA